MKKKLLSLLTVSMISLGLLVGCGGNTAPNTSSNGDALKIGMSTDSGTIDDKSFNQGCWEGILKSKEELGTDVKYLQPSGETEADYLKEIGNLYDAGYKFIVLPGFKFETAVYKAQDKYKDANFVIIDGEPRDDSGNSSIANNTVAIYFAEEQAGFIAGIAASLEIKEGALGFIGGMESNAVQKYNWGFQQGVAYANENLGTNMTLSENNIVYSGSFSDSALGQQLAATMFDDGVKAIFCAAGGVGNGAITEAKTRASQGEEAWIIGVDIDQYADGLYSDNKSVILTSAIKNIESASYNVIKDFKDGNFEGGKVLRFDITNEGIGIPAENPNLSADTMSEVEKLYAELKAGNITVSAEQGDLIK
ncbi:MAG: BMP family ABC transporter substrate-binding protein [Clostridium butyricum]|nr:BMP family ABC transporter substrate-binding protein [Clostridium butyricum]